ncbi:MAG TPA: chloride channel protein [Gemmatimonadales bacterium]|nr:chloride channel protein [Gemmatimonadales bacterium]
MRSLPDLLWRAVDRLRGREDQLALVLSLMIGAVVGLVVVAFILLTGRLAAHIYPAGSAGWRRIAAPVLGALITGWFLARHFPGARGSGIPQTKAALLIEDGFISMRTVLAKFFLCCGSLASGIALGREGPSVHVGAGISSVIGRRLGLTREQVRWLLPVGTSAALAAAFNTPIAAVLFSLEEIIGDLHAPVLGSVVISSATSWMVLHLVLGDEPLFHVAAYHLVNPAELGIYAVLGIVGGLGSAVFVKLLLGLRLRFRALPPRTLWLQPAVGGLTVGVMGYFIPQVLGVGYDEIGRILNGDIILRTVLLLAALKIVATAVCYASGNAGGIFGPSLFIGAMLGGTVGGVAQLLFPGHTAGAGAYALVGMGTAFAGIVRTPLTSVIMIFEVTRDYSIIVPLMVSNLIAFFISARLQPVPVYEALAQQDGLHLPGAESRSASERVPVRRVMRAAPAPLADTTELADALARMREAGADAWPVAGREGFRGMVGRDAVEGALASGEGGPTIAGLVREAADPGEPESGAHVHPDHAIGVALARMGAAGLAALPVVSRRNARELLGIVTLQDLLAEFGLGAPRDARSGDV